MDKRLRELGEEVTACPARRRCPGVLQGRLANDPSGGIPPRGLFIRPCTAALEDVEVVVLGLNPGRADEQERGRLQEASSKYPTRLFRYVHAETIFEMRRWKYWRRIDNLLGLLGFRPGAHVVLAAELVFCECEKPPRPPPGNRPKRVQVGRPAINFCSGLYLEKVMPLLPANPLLIAVGGQARDWIRRSRWSDTFFSAHQK